MVALCYKYSLDCIDFVNNLNKYMYLCANRRTITTKPKGICKTYWFP